MERLGDLQLQVLRIIGEKEEKGEGLIQIDNEDIGKIVTYLEEGAW